MNILPHHQNICDVWEGTVASWLLHSTPERAVRVRALARDIVLCSWGKHFTLTVPLFTQVYLNGYWRICDGLASHPGGIRNTLSHFMLRKPDGPLGSYADLTFTYLGALTGLKEHFLFALYICQIIIITFIYANFMYWLDYFRGPQGHQLYLNCYVLPS